MPTVDELRALIDALEEGFDVDLVHDHSETESDTRYKRSTLAVNGYMLGWDLIVFALAPGDESSDD